MNKHNLKTIETTLLRGRVNLLQPQVGFHASIDAVFLAAAALVKDRFKVLDVGCGVGSVGLCITSRNKTISLTGIDIQKELVDLAHQNAALNGVADRCRFFQGDIKKEKIIENNYFNAVVMNPPYLTAATHPLSPDPIKATSHGESASDTTLVNWIKYSHLKLKQGGTLTMIHRADRMGDIIHSLTHKKWFGSLVIYPLCPHAGENAKRIIVSARKERYAALVLKSGMIVHKPDGSYTDAAHKILSDAESIPV